MCRRFPQQQSIAIIEKALGKPVTELFASFESTPMASASVAQVHGATLHSGEQVVVKVVRPDIEPVIRAGHRSDVYAGAAGRKIPSRWPAPAPGGGGVRLRAGHSR